jgi:hypothetical protein
MRRDGELLIGWDEVTMRICRRYALNPRDIAVRPCSVGENVSLRDSQGFYGGAIRSDG